MAGECGCDKKYLTRIINADEGLPGRKRGVRALVVSNNTWSYASHPQENTRRINMAQTGCLGNQVQRCTETMC